MSTDLQSVAARLEGAHENGNGYMARCPFHDDQTPSMHVWEEDGHVRAYCHGSCDRYVTDELMKSLGLRPQCEVKSDESSLHEIEAEYLYVDEDGTHLFTVCRTRDKRFPGWRPDPTATSGEQWKLKGEPGVPYHLPRLIQGVREGATIHVVDGEKDVEAIEGVGGFATTAPIGPASGLSILSTLRTFAAPKSSCGATTAARGRPRRGASPPPFTA